MFDQLCISGKGKRLKQAKEEAQAEIEAYRNKRENEYKAYEQKVWALLTLNNCKVFSYLILM